MRAFVVNAEDTSRFDEVTRDAPAPGPTDLLVEVKAISLNPVDTKVRGARAGRILGWDASGVVAAVGAGVSHYKLGDEVYYAGDITRDGTNAELHCVDERIVGRKPRTLDHLHAAAIPLTALTAWEGLYEQIQVREGASLLVINSAGGVGSLVCQIAKKISKMTVIGTASRPESVAWSKEMGADHVIDHRGDMPAQLAALGLDGVDYIYCCHGTDEHFDAMAAMLRPQGRIVSIVECKALLPMMSLFGKKATFSWELMFTKARFKTPDMSTQRDILDRVADLLDEGVLRSTLTRDGGTLTADALAEAHRIQASGTMIGKMAFRI
ncbi:MAG: zinc-binding alcohol dehydrogenase family protein [Polyangiaceae bacterium]|nr:zinc-binding alcohol dehydrogenase family protein [Polyangiaceae bacterium]